MARVERVPDFLDDLGHQVRLHRDEQNVAVLNQLRERGRCVSVGAGGLSGSDGGNEHNISVLDQLPRSGRKGGGGPGEEGSERTQVVVIHAGKGNAPPRCCLGVAAAPAAGAPNAVGRHDARGDKPFCERLRHRPGADEPDALAGQNVRRPRVTCARCAPGGDIDCGACSGARTSTQAGIRRLKGCADTAQRAGKQAVALLWLQQRHTMAVDARRWLIAPLESRVWTKHAGTVPLTVQGRPRGVEQAMLGKCCAYC
eukprot:362589-Chlamydomonas_euryale.AAC.8